MSQSATADDQWLTQWRALWQRLGVAEMDAEYFVLRSAYDESSRHYHTFEHIAACLNWLQRAYQDQVLQRDDGLELAIWYHDAIYKPMRSDNEAASARWWRDTATRHGLSESLIARVERWILATQHAVQESVPDALWLLDIDLAILGSRPEVYAQFERNVRAEYRWVPSLIFRQKRAALLQDFLDRPRLYLTDYFHRQLDQQARQNLRQAIAELCG
ncbi:hypothetical protein [Chitinivorax sp. B]|uniref:HD domain-containing protein n=1 Tax=Chitinivorax sp. B TaxID=2502235 RepID=UPI0010F8BE52|nr:hypothetical protein [Chitinivorax sp. B]